MLKDANQITTRSTSVATILTLCNYDTYNPISQAEVQAEGIAKQRNGTPLTQNTATGTAQISSTISNDNEDNSQADGQAEGKRTASGRHELNKGNKGKNKEKEEEKEIFLISNPEEAPLHIQDNSFMDYNEDL